MNTTGLWQTNGYLHADQNAFQKRYDSGMWVRIHCKVNGTFEVRASSAIQMTYADNLPIVTTYPTVEAAMAAADRRFSEDVS